MELSDILHELVGIVADMRKQGWVHDGRTPFRMTGPYPKISPIALPKVKARQSASQMLAGVKEGNRFLDDGFDGTQMMPVLGACDYWVFELAGVFIRPEIQVEIPKLHEERT